MEEEGRNWMTPIIECLEKGIWPNDENEARPIKSKLHNKGSTQRGVWNGHRSEIRGGEDHEARVLLAEHARRYQGSDRQM
ncbi:hypothetical protein Tco_0104577 [Tanacetum coccineum]